jgi:hypothetical protein
MKPAAGPILRRLGLLIEIACLLAIVTLKDDRREVAGFAVRDMLIAGVAFGFVLWGVSQVLLFRAARKVRPMQ